MERDVMGKILNTDEALVILKKHYVTQDIQMVSRYLRDKRLKGEKISNKDGWRINEEDLYDFIDNEKPGIVQVIHVYEQHINNLYVDSSPEEYLKKDSKRNLEKIKMMVPYLSAMVGTDREKVSENQFPDEDDKEDRTINQLKVFIDNEIKAAMSQVHDSINNLTHVITKMNLNMQKTSVVGGEKSGDKSEKNQGKGPHNKKSYIEFKSLLKEYNLIPDINVMESEEQILKRIYSVYYDENKQLRQTVFNRDLMQFVCPHTDEKHKHFKFLMKKVFPMLKQGFEKAVSATSPDSNPPSENQNGQQDNRKMIEGEEEI